MTSAPCDTHAPDYTATGHTGFGVHATARITATATAGTTDLPLLHGDGPFDLRRMHPRGSQARICMLNAMSAPHNGDRLRIEVDIGPGADLQVTSATATIALPGPTPGHATYDVTIRVAESARLHWLPEPVISTADSDLRQSFRIELAPTARLLLAEQQILGRTHQPPGRLTSRLTVDRAGRPLLDQSTDYGPGAPGWDGPAVLAGNRATGQLLVIDPELQDRPPDVRLLGDPPTGAHGMITPLAGPGVLLTAVAPEAGSLRHCLDTALQHLRLQEAETGPFGLAP